MNDPARGRAHIAAFVRSAFLSCASILTALGGFVAKAEEAPPPAAAFARRELVSNPKLSPDGVHLLVRQRVLINGADVPVMYVYRLSDMAVLAQVRLPPFIVPADYWWVSNTRVVVATGRVFGSLETPQLLGELLAVNLDGTGQEYLFGYDIGRYTRRSQMSDRGWGDVAGIAEQRDGHFFVNDHTWVKTSTHTLLYDINSKGGARKVLGEAPFREAKFLVQRNGIPRFATAWDDSARYQVLQYVDDKKEWVSLNADKRERLVPMAFNADDSEVFAGLSEKGGPQMLVRQSVATGKREVLASDSVGSIDNVEWGPRRLAPVLANTQVGIPSPRYIEPASGEAQLHQALAAQFPGKFVSFETFSDDGQKLVFSVKSDRDPGGYYLLDRKTHQAEMLFASAPQIDPARMGVRRPIHFNARDGLELHGYLTLPPGRGDKNLPLVLYPHGGPQSADTWFYDEHAQFLATRGYAVLQVNFRGSSGRGTAFQNASWHHWGDLMPDDLIDGVRWAIAQGVADPGRICAYGGSFGAYASMMVAIRAPELFKCAVGYAGVYDLAGMHETDEVRGSDTAKAYWSRVIGKDPDELARFSPAKQADKITVPVLLVHGEEDWRTPVDQFKTMRDALQKAGKPVELMLVEKEGHGFYLERNRLAFLEKLEAFLAKHLQAAPKVQP